jgi:hypothetical protein
MASNKQIYVPQDHNQQPIKQPVLDPLAVAPASPVAGQHYYNTTDNTPYFFDGINWVAYPTTASKLRYQTSAGRFYCYTDNRWCTYNTSYGSNYINQATTGGTGATPSIVWDGNGMPFPPGATMNRIWFKGRMNSAQVTDMEVYIRAHDTDWTANLAIDSAAEVGASEVLAVTTVEMDPGAGDSADMRGSEIALNGYQFTNWGDLQIFMRPVGTITATRYYIGWHMVEWEVA